MSEHDSEDLDADGNYCGTGGPRPPIGDPTFGSMLLFANESRSGIRVSWTYTTDLPWGVASITVYRSTGSTFSAAVQSIWTGMSSSYLDTPEDLQAETRYYYWIKLTSVNGTETAIVGPADAMMKTATELTVQNLYDSITGSQLNIDLMTQINSITDFTTALNLQDDKFDQINTVISGVLTDFEADLVADGTALLDTKIELQEADYNAVIALEGIAALYEDSFAGILNEQIVYANATSALGQEVQRVEALVGTNSALVQENSLAFVDLEAGVRSNWTLKTQATNANGTVVAGIGLEVTDIDPDNPNSGAETPISRFIVRADQFAVMASTYYPPGQGPVVLDIDDPNYDPAVANAFYSAAVDEVIPFAVGQVTDPATGVTQATTVITKAMIEDASITTLRIGGQAVTVPTYSSFADPSTIVQGTRGGSTSGGTFYHVFSTNQNKVNNYSDLPNGASVGSNYTVLNPSGNPALRTRRYRRTSSGWTLNGAGPGILYQQIVMPEGGSVVTTFNAQYISTTGNNDSLTGWAKFKMTCERITNFSTFARTPVGSASYKELYLNTFGSSSTDLSTPISFSASWDDPGSYANPSIFIITVLIAGNQARLEDGTMTTISVKR